ncbi:UNVERIFIED_CONTAM: putative receptor-like serine/threonine-protein kinase [Sesamum radiatum]|uniref:Receptor-like serine/threonine-protein kinase n=2 Tax=Sesamum TaxID=4181 RepID=A0AAW2S5F5_SESRA
MTVERSNLGKKNVVVGIRFDGHAQELLDWALMKVACPGDGVVAIHVCRNSGCAPNERASLDGFLEDYQGLCKKRQVALSGEVFKGNSLRKVVVREAKKRSASAVIVGITKHSAFGGWASVAKYCIQRLPPTTDVMTIYNGKLTTQSEFGESEISETRRYSIDGRDSIVTSRNNVLSPVGRHKRGSLSLIPLPVEDFTEQRPGWPLLQTPSLTTQKAKEARKMSVVQWVMSLPRRSLSEVSESDSAASKTEDFLKRENGELASQKELQKTLALILKKNPAVCDVFRLDVLRKSTSEFSSGNLIGKGGCNSVYKGILPEGKPVAVKILESSKEAWKDFVREVDIMTTVKHKRITPLLGICIKDDMLLSAYDFLSKGNLEENLHSKSKEKSVLPWEVRFQIAVGVAEALNYLHNECPKPVIHRDVKSSNILLTEDLEPQLCDFGLAIWGPTTASFLMDTDVVGTFGYLAPEYFMYGKISDKIDVYAFGVVLLELLSGRKPIGLETTKGQESLVMWAKPKLESGNLKSMLDPNLDGSIGEAQMHRMALAAKLCLTQAARSRPTMNQILSILNGEEGKLECKKQDDSESQEDNDDEVYPDSSAESHLNLAFLDVNDNSTSFSSLDQSSPLSVEEYLKKRWSRSSSLE